MKDLTKGDETKQLIGFALPMLLGNIFQQFYNMVDSFVVGRFLGTTALAAVGTSFPIIFFMLSLIMGVAMGSTVLISQFFGAKDPGNLRKVISTSYIFLLIAGTIMSAVGVLSTSFILKALAVPADIMPEASAYLRIIFAGMLATFGNASGPVAPFSPLELSGKSLFVTRPRLFDYIVTTEELDESAQALFAVLASGAVQIDIGQTFPLSEARAAHEALEGRRTTGTTLLLP